MYWAGCGRRRQVPYPVLTITRECLNGMHTHAYGVYYDMRVQTVEALTNEASVEFLPYRLLRQTQAALGMMFGVCDP